MCMIIAPVIRVLSAEHALSPAALSTGFGGKETKVLNLLIFLSLLCVYCLTPCQNSVHFAKLKRK